MQSTRHRHDRSKIDGLHTLTQILSIVGHDINYSRQGSPCEMGAVTHYGAIVFRRLAPLIRCQSFAIRTAGVSTSSTRETSALFSTFSLAIITLAVCTPYSVLGQGADRRAIAKLKVMNLLQRRWVPSTSVHWFKREVLHKAEREICSRFSIPTY
jgi:hypothetical protein